MVQLNRNHERDPVKDKVPIEDKMQRVMIWLKQVPVSKLSHHK